MNTDEPQRSEMLVEKRWEIAVKPQRGDRLVKKRCENAVEPQRGDKLVEKRGENAVEPQRGDRLVEKRGENAVKLQQGDMLKLLRIFFIHSFLPTYRPDGACGYFYIFSTDISPRWGLTAFCQSIQLICLTFCKL